MKSIIMAGGSGTRLWPLSRKNFPKQFLSLVDGKSFIQISAGRMSLMSAVNDIYVVAGEEYQYTIIEHLSKQLQCNFKNLILEPSGRNTAPAIALTIKYLLEKELADPKEVIFFSPSDHIIHSEKQFIKYVKDAENLAKESIVTFGIIPDKPETGYGYIELGKQISSNAFYVDKFIEKPDKEHAEKYLKSGNYLWNSGMFMFSIEVILKAFEEFAPEFYKIIKEWDYSSIIANYDKLPSISIDYAIMEKVNNIVCKKVSIKWNDIGSWDSLYEIFPKDNKNNVILGDVETLNVENSLIISQNKLTALIGVTDIAVIETPDAILISDRKQTQNVKEIVNILKDKKRKEAYDHLTTYRPWGKYTILEESERYKIKKITVNQGSSLSLQRHAHRSEHWIVVKGTALVVIDGRELFIHENESTFIPKSSLHRLSNPGKLPLEIIEVQNGEYVGEDDIERIDDNYGRK